MDGNELTTLLLEYKQSLDKMLMSRDADSQCIIDTLNNLRKLPVDLALLRKTSIVASIQNMKRSCPEGGDPIRRACQDLVDYWKTCCLKEAKKPTQGASKPARRALIVESDSDESPRKDSKRIKTATDNDNNNAIDPKSFRGIPQNRQKVCSLLAECLQSEDGTGIPRARALAIDIETSIESLHSSSETSSDSGKGYIMKARSLLYNLRRNDPLRTAILTGEVQPSSLVSLSSEDLATEEIKVQRRKEIALAVMEHRKDVHIVRASTGEMVGEVISVGVSEQMREGKQEEGKEEEGGDAHDTCVRDDGHNDHEQEDVFMDSPTPIRGSVAATKLGDSHDHLSADQRSIP